jgi:hypothetical protein
VPRFVLGRPPEHPAVAEDAILRLLDLERFGTVDLGTDQLVPPRQVVRERPFELRPKLATVLDRLRIGRVGRGQYGDRGIGPTVEFGEYPLVGIDFRDPRIHQQNDDLIVAAGLVESFGQVVEIGDVRTEQALGGERTGVRDDRAGQSRPP